MAGTNKGTVHGTRVMAKATPDKGTSPKGKQTKPVRKAKSPNAKKAPMVWGRGK